MSEVTTVIDVIKSWLQVDGGDLMTDDGLLHARGPSLWSGEILVGVRWPDGSVYILGASELVGGPNSELSVYINWAIEMAASLCDLTKVFIVPATGSIEDFLALKAFVNFPVQAQAHECFISFWDLLHLPREQRHARLEELGEQYRQLILVAYSQAPNREAGPGGVNEDSVRKMLKSVFDTFEGGDGGRAT